MDKKIHIAFTENKLETYIKTPLVRGDKNVYKLIMNLGKYPDAKYVFIYAERSDGKIFYDSFEITGNTAEYTLKQSVYSVLGEVTLRIVLKDTGETSLTTAVLRFNAVEGTYHENMAEDMGSLEDILLAAKNKADKAETLSGYGITDAYTKAEIDEMMENMGNSEDTYTKAEIDKMVSGVYRFCGTAMVTENFISAFPTRAGDVFNVAKGGTYSMEAEVSLPITNIEAGVIFIEGSEDINVLASAIMDENHVMWVGEKGSGYNAPIMIHNVKIIDIDPTTAILSFDYYNPSPDTQITAGQEICFAQWRITAEMGDNIAWTGKIWDKL